jgi:hypothetical protein
MTTNDKTPAAAEQTEQITIAGDTYDPAELEAYEGDPILVKLGQLTVDFSVLSLTQDHLEPAPGTPEALWEETIAAVAEGLANLSTLRPVLLLRADAADQAAEEEADQPLFGSAVPGIASTEPPQNQ